MSTIITTTTASCEQPSPAHDYDLTNNERYYNFDRFICMDTPLLLSLPRSQRAATCGCGRRPAAPAPLVRLF